MQGAVKRQKETACEIEARVMGREFLEPEDAHGLERSDLTVAIDGQFWTISISGPPSLIT